MNMMNEQEITETVKKELKANFNPEDPNQEFPAAVVGNSEVRGGCL